MEDLASQGTCQIRIAGDAVSILRRLLTLTSLWLRTGCVGSRWLWLNP